TVVWVSYDDEAIYVAGRMLETSPDSIVALLGRRDQDLASDYFAIGIDSYHDKQTGFYFLVTPCGAIADGRIYNDSWFDDTWDGVWDSAAKIDSLGWCAEMRIPFSQLRFTKKTEYVWGFNVERFIQRKQETSQLVLIPKESSGHISFYPSLVGIKYIQPPRRLEFLPYAVTSGQFLSYGPDDPFDRDFIFYKSAGADLKIGLSSNFTLDGTVNPDFGQVELDPAVVNLTAFETFFDEKRPFFIEGADIFSFGQRGATNYWGFNSNIPTFFYSRRIGRTPQVEPIHDGEEDIPPNTTIIGATKISGKTRHNWEIGVLNALTSREYAEVDSEDVRFQEEAEPLTFYNVTRAFKNFKDNRLG
ncbi:MAG: hydrolase, partial [Calditrichae bacterium]|nr:hydrolase [Calditrichia bacterium]